MSLAPPLLPSKRNSSDEANQASERGVGFKGLIFPGKRAVKNMLGKVWIHLDQLGPGGRPDPREEPGDRLAVLQIGFAEDPSEFDFLVQDNVVINRRAVPSAIK